MLDRQDVDDRIVRSVMDLGAEEVHETPGLLQIRPVGEDAWRDVDSWEGAAGPVRRLRPALSEEQAQELQQHCRGIDAASVEYGAPLPVLTTGPGIGRDWLEVAVAAGHVPHQEGIELAQQGLFVLIRAWVQEAMDQGELGEAERWLSFADVYRAFAGTLTQEAERLEARRDELLGDAP